MRPIDADELQQVFNETSTALMREPKLSKDIEHMIRAFLMTTEMIKDAPTIEAEPVKHAKWKLYAKTRDNDGCIVNYFVCSNCDNMIPDVPEGLAPDIISPYCAKCGTRMDGDAE